MRLAFLSVSSEMGGSEVSLLELIKGLRRLAPAWDLHLVIPREGSLGDRAGAAGATVHVLAWPRRLASVGEPGRDLSPVALAQSATSVCAAAVSAVGYERRLRRLIAAINPDVVHTNGFKLHLLGTPAARRHSAIVWHVHEYIGRRRVTAALLQAQSPRASAIVANSDSVRADLMATLGPRVPVTRIYNAVDVAEFAPAGPIADLDGLSGLAPAAEGTVRIGLVATYGRWKGQDVFLQSLRAARPRTRVRGYIVGGALYDTAGSQYSRDELARMIADAGLTGDVGLTGFIERSATAMRALDVVVHASTEPEPFGLVIAEAKACGRALVASSGGGASELVTDGVDALTHRPGDVAGLAAAIERLADDAALRDRLGHAARESAVRQFDADSFARSFMCIYDSARRRSVA